MPAIRRLAVAMGVALVALVATLTTAVAQWPTTCVELNDLAEAAAGHHQNVGLYQRAYGADAEARCQADHLQDVYRTYGWAFEAFLRTMPPAPTSAHPDYELVAATARARGAPDAGGVARDVIARGAVDAFLQGTDPVPYGAYGCAYRSPECPLAAERSVPRPPPRRRVASGLQAAWDLLTTTTIASFTDAPRGQSVRIAWGALPDTTLARYWRADHRITIRQDLRGERVESLATLLAHELVHAVIIDKEPPGFQGCLWGEIMAHSAVAWLWHELGPLTPRSALERSHQAVTRVFMYSGHPWGDLDHDLSDWAHVLPYLLDDLGYDESCQT